MTSAQEPLPSDRRAERLLASLAGIVSAHVVEEAGGRIVEIHILSSPDLHPKQVVRNVESALSAGLGIEIDRRIVSVAQIRSAGAVSSASAGPAEAPANGTARLATEAGAASDSGSAAPEPAGTRRLEYVRYESRREEGRCRCEVILRNGDEVVRGESEAADTAAGRAEAAADAVLDAVVQARSQLRLHLEGVVISASRGRSFVIVSAHAVSDRNSIRLAGAAPLTRSPEEAAILAALQATNRWSA